MKKIFLDFFFIDFTKIVNGTDANSHSINANLNEIDPLKRKILNSNYNATDLINQFTNATEIKQSNNVTLNYQPIENKSRLFVTNVSQCAENHQKFCTKNDDYPVEYIQKLLYHLPPEYERFFYEQAVSRSSKPTKDSVEEEKNGGVITPIDADYDNDEKDDPVEMCETYEKIIYPTSGTTESGDGLFIFNMADHGHRQGVHIQMCQNVEKPCDDFVILRNNYRSECKQQKVYRDMLSLSPDGKPVSERFEFPVSCTCVLRRVKQSKKRNGSKLLGF